MCMVDNSEKDLLDSSRWPTPSSLIGVQHEIVQEVLHCAIYIIPATAGIDEVAVEEPHAIEKDPDTNDEATGDNGDDAGALFFYFILWMKPWRKA